MSRHLPETNLPAGVTTADIDRAAGDEDTPCTCGHFPYEHEDGHGPCYVTDCDCDGYEPDDEAVEGI